MVLVALGLIPFAPIAFLWFIGEVRHHIGDLEDRFFATVFLGSGLLFLAGADPGAASGEGVRLAFGDRAAPELELDPVDIADVILRD